MKTALISNENNLAKFTIDFTAEEFDAACDKAFRSMRNQFRVDGFRKGKAPRSIIEKRFGEGVFFEEAINSLFRENYNNAVKELDLEPIADPTADFSEIAKGTPLTMTFIVALFPKVEVKDYMGIEVEQIEDPVKDEEIDSEIEMLQKRNSRLVTVDREIKSGDTVIFDYAGTVDGVAFDGGTAENADLVIGSRTFIPGFEDQMIGHKAGEEFDVNVTFPEVYQEKSLEGKDAVFACKVHEVKEEQLPELDDEFAKDVSEFDTLEELRASKKDEIAARKENFNAEMARNAMVDKIWEANKVEVPQSMIDAEIDSMLADYEQQLSMTGFSLKQYTEMMKQSMDEFRAGLKDDAEKRVGQRIVLRSIAEKEGVQATDEDIDNALTNIGSRYGMKLEDIKSALGDDAVKMVEQDVIVMNTVTKLWENAKITKVDPPAVDVKEAAEEPAEEAAEAAEAPAEAE